MPAVVLVTGERPVTLHMTSEPVTLFPGVPLEVPRGYRDVLVRRDLTAPHVIEDVPDAPTPKPSDGPAPKPARARSKK